MTSRAAGAAPGAARTRIPPPDGSKEPMKVNLFERMQHTNTELVPLFPYYGPGSFVPAGAIFRGDAELDMGHFFHQNTTDEVVVVYGGNGALLQTGQIMATAKLHGVNTFLRDPRNPESFLVLTVTQRQSDGQDQTESLIWRCRKCHEYLHRYEFDATPQDVHRDRFPAFPTLTEGAVAAEQYNADSRARVCPKCGYDNGSFPLERWGWKQWAVQWRTVNDARRALLNSAAEQLQTG